MHSLDIPVLANKDCVGTMPVCGKKLGIRPAIACAYLVPACVLIGALIVSDPRPDLVASGVLGVAGATFMLTYAIYYRICPDALYIRSYGPEQRVAWVDIESIDIGRPEGSWVGRMGIVRLRSGETANIVAILYLGPWRARAERTIAELTEEVERHRSPGPLEGDDEVAGERGDGARDHLD